jgi:PHD/YefM family antitoxin component YafN of YafNO toxin-antitoxin module
LIVAKGSGRILAHHLHVLHDQLNLQLYEFDELRETLEHIDARSIGNLETWLVGHRESQMLRDRADSEIAPILALAPYGITVHPQVQSGEVWLRFRGLAFARWDDHELYFGTSERKEKLTAVTQESLKQLLNELETARHPLAGNTRHPLYRAQPERWLESIVKKDVSRVDPALDPRFVYTQVFASNAHQRGILDVLTVTRSGRLAILELKASEHIHLPLQAADYWLRITRHLKGGDFSRHGYFAGIELQDTPPLVYLVAPALRFHPCTDVLMRYLSPQIEFVRVGLAETWRRGLRVVMRQ